MCRLTYLMFALPFRCLGLYLIAYLKLSRLMFLILFASRVVAQSVTVSFADLQLLNRSMLLPANSGASAPPTSPATTPKTKPVGPSLVASPQETSALLPRQTILQHHSEPNPSSQQLHNPAEHSVEYIRIEPLPSHLPTLSLRYQSYGPPKLTLLLYRQLPWLTILLLHPHLSVQRRTTPFS